MRRLGREQFSVGSFQSEVFNGQSAITVIKCEVSLQRFKMDLHGDNNSP